VVLYSLHSPFPVVVVGVVDFDSSDLQKVPMVVAGEAVVGVDFAPVLQNISSLNHQVFEFVQPYQ
jgi:hypothetical protein